MKTTMRTIRVPWTDRWLTRFNKLFAIDKSTYDGRFTSRLGNGYCTGVPHTGMLYHFTDECEKVAK